MIIHCDVPYFLYYMGITITTLFRIVTSEEPLKV